MAIRNVFCSRLKKEAPGLESPPFSGELGQEIFDKVSAESWLQWQDDMMIKIINEYRLDLTDVKQYNVLLDQMRAFLGLKQDDNSVLEVENADRGRAKP